MDFGEFVKCGFRFTMSSEALLVTSSQTFPRYCDVPFVVFIISPDFLIFYFVFFSLKNFICSNRVRCRKDLIRSTCKTLSSKTSQKTKTGVKWMRSGERRDISERRDMENEVVSHVLTEVVF